MVSRAVLKEILPCDLQAYVSTCRLHKSMYIFIFLCINIPPGHSKGSASLLHMALTAPAGQSECQSPSRDVCSLAASHK
jgi:hypothetical protein